MYLLTQESKTWKIEEEARLRFSALNEADATHRFLTALFMDYTLLPTILSFQANSHSVSTREKLVKAVSVKGQRDMTYRSVQDTAGGMKT